MQRLRIVHALPMILALPSMSLNGAPGVYSARYAGRHGDDQC